MDFLRRVWHIFSVIAPSFPYIIPLFVSAAVWIATSVFYPNSIAFEVVRDLFLILIPSTALALAFRTYRKNMEKKMTGVRQLCGEIKNGLIGLEGRLQQLSNAVQQDKYDVTEKLERLNGYALSYNKLFTKPCPNCKTPICIDVPSALVKDIHSVDGPPSGRFGVGREMQIVCQSCGEVYHVVYP